MGGHAAPGLRATVGSDLRSLGPPRERPKYAGDRPGRVQDSTEVSQPEGKARPGRGWGSEHAGQSPQARPVGRKPTGASRSAGPARAAGSELRAAGRDATAAAASASSRRRGELPPPVPAPSQEGTGRSRWCCGKWQEREAGTYLEAPRRATVELPAAAGARASSAGAGAATRAATPRVAQGGQSALEPVGRRGFPPYSAALLEENPVAGEGVPGPWVSGSPVRERSKALIYPPPVPPPAAMLALKQAREMPVGWYRAISRLSRDLVGRAVVLDGGARGSGGLGPSTPSHQASCPGGAEPGVRSSGQPLAPPPARRPRNAGAVGPLLPPPAPPPAEALARSGRPAARLRGGTAPGPAVRTRALRSPRAQPRRV
ncbi:putative uncharacterized protein C1orf229 [Nannospalax galili]|uniref:putative uncharacterized protein C1orf229 n=1 Tax=Nannospalax galili TaxID=1026970 RepID=UPI0004ED2386|nr:putative uncharacterized protein C1orf229 [Nannospalax galili]